MKNSSDADKALRAMLRTHDILALEQQIENLKRQIAEINSTKRGLIDREVKALGLINKHVMRGAAEYVITSYRIRLSGIITLRGRKILKDGSLGKVEVDLYGWDAK